MSQFFPHFFTFSLSLSLSLPLSLLGSLYPSLPLSLCLSPSLPLTPSHSLTSSRSSYSAPSSPSIKTHTKEGPALSKHPQSAWHPRIAHLRPHTRAEGERENLPDTNTFRPLCLYVGVSEMKVKDLEVESFCDTRWLENKQRTINYTKLQKTRVQSTTKNCISLHSLSESRSSDVEELRLYLNTRLGGAAAQWRAATASACVSACVHMCVWVCVLDWVCLCVCACVFVCGSVRVCARMHAPRLTKRPLFPGHVHFLRPVRGVRGGFINWW